jgi:hypothetical protein
MIRGTDTAFKFHIPCSFYDIGWVAIKFWQENNEGTETHPLPIIKSLEDCYPDGVNILGVILSTTETARFSADRKGCVQLLAKIQDDRGGGTFGCKKKEFTVHSMEEDIIEAWFDAEE